MEEAPQTKPCQEAVQEAFLAGKYGTGDAAQKIMAESAKVRRGPRSVKNHDSNTKGEEIYVIYVLIEHGYNGKRSINHPCKGYSDIMGI